MPRGMWACGPRATCLAFNARDRPGRTAPIRCAGGARGGMGRGGRRWLRRTAPAGRPERADHDGPDHQRDREQDRGASRRMPPPSPSAELLNGRHRLVPGQPGEDPEQRLEAGIARQQRFPDPGQNPFFGSCQTHLCSPVRATTPPAPRARRFPADHGRLARIQLPRHRVRNGSLASRCGRMRAPARGLGRNRGPRAGGVSPAAASAARRRCPVAAGRR